MEGDSGLDVLSNDENDGILDIIPQSEYDPFEAKFCASLFWLVFHATEDGGLEDVPSQVTSPIQRTDKKNGFVVHPEIVEFLCKGEVYCTVCTRIFPGKVTLAGHWSVIQTLSRNSVYVVDGNTDIAVTDASLEQKNPFHQGAHIALMDALMTAYSSQVVSIQKVVQAVRRFSTFSASRELPFDLEDALLLWVNKTNMAVNSKYTQPTRSSTGKLLRNREQIKKAGLRAKISEDTPSVVFPVIDDVLKGLCDGRSLLGVLMFYEPSVTNIEDICCSSVISTEDSIRNLDVFLGLCSQYFCTSVLALKVEDILYGSPYLKINIVALLAEIFSKCEGNVKAGQEIPRSKTSCSENGDVRVNGHDSVDGGGSRSHSAPVSGLSHSYDKLSMSNTMPDSVKQDRNIALRIQNYVENESVDIETESSGKNVCLDKITSSNVASSNKKSVNMTPSSMTSVSVTSSDTNSSNWASSDDVPSSSGDGTNTVEVQGVVVKLRKRLPRSVEPGGGHEALHSRRMKKSLCGQSQEDVSDIASQTSDNEEQFDVKSDEAPSHPDLSRHDDPNLQHPLTTFDHHESHHSLNLDLKLPEDDPPVDMLSPISETTEPGGSPGNSLNNSLSSSHDQQELLHKNLGGAKDFNLTPPEAQTPRKSINIHQSANDDLVPRGSYIIADVNHTPESAIAAGIPVVERELILSNSRESTSTILGHSSDGAQLYRSSFSDVSLTNESHKDVQSNLVHERSNITEQLLLPSARGSSRFSDQRYHTMDRARQQPSTTTQRYVQEDSNPEQSENKSEERTQSRPTANHWSERRGDNRFSTFTKSKNNHNGMDTGEDLDHPSFPVKDQSGEIRKEKSFKTFAELENAKINSGPPITWFGPVKNEEMRAAEFGGDSGSHRVMPSALKTGVRKTNWGEMASEMNENSNLMQKGLIPEPTPGVSPG